MILYTHNNKNNINKYLKNEMKLIYYMNYELCCYIIKVKLRISIYLILFHLFQKNIY